MADTTLPPLTGPMRRSLPGIPGFQLERRLGGGASGDVYLARPDDPALPHRVALKVLRERAMARETELRRFVREGRLGRSLNHPNILRVHDVFEWGPTLVLVQEYVEASTLRDWRPVDVNGEPLSGRALVEARVGALVQVARALEAAHSEGVVHRDVKPTNMLVEADGRALLIDFGLAKDADDDSTLTATNVLMGSPAYMAPELVSGRAREADARADVWSLGVSLFELVTGRPPFEGSTREELWLSVLHSEPPRLGPCGPVALPGLEPVVLRALEKDPERRHPDAGALADDLSAWLDGDLSLHGSGTLLRRWRRQLLRRRAGVLGVVVVLLGLWAGALLREARLGRLEVELVGLLAEGDRHLDDGDLTRALENYDRAADVLPEDPRPHLHRAVAWAGFERLGAAADAIARATALGWEPDLSRADGRLHAGLFAAARVSIDEGLEHMLLAIQVDPSLESAYIPLHGLLVGQQRLADAARVLDAWQAQAEPQDPRADLAAALRLEAEGDVEAALERLPAAGEDDEQTFWRHRHRGRLLIRSGDLEAARRELTLALQVVPLDAPSWHNLGLAALLSGDSEAALAHAHDALAIAPSLRRSVDLAVSAVHASRGPQAAVEELERHMPAFPELVGRAATLRADLADRARRAGESETARGHWQRVVELRPGDVRARVRLGMDAWNRDRWEDVVEHLAMAHQRLDAGADWPADLDPDHDRLAMLVALYSANCQVRRVLDDDALRADIEGHLGAHPDASPVLLLVLAEAVALLAPEDRRDMPWALELVSASGVDPDAEPADAATLLARRIRDAAS